MICITASTTVIHAVAENYSISFGQIAVVIYVDIQTIMPQPVQVESSDTLQT